MARRKVEEDEEFEDEIEEESDEDEYEELMDNDEISPEEEAFIRGYEDAY